MLSRLRHLGLFTFLLAGSSLSVAADTQAPRELWHQAVEQQYAELASSTQRLERSASRYCATPDEQRLTSVQDDWLSAYQAWQAVRFINFGPIEQNSRSWQLQFWPDRKNLVGSKVQAWLKAPESPDAEAIGSDSVAIQGFPALEYLLYDAGMANTQLSAPPSCGLLQAITTHLADTTHALHRDWQTFGDHYRDTDIYTATTLHSAIQALETLEDKRLADPMGLSGTPANGYLAEGWRSATSIRLIEGTLEGLRTGLQPGLTALLTEAEHPELAAEFRDLLDAALGLAGELHPGLAPALEDQIAFSGLQDLYLKTAQLRRLLGEEIASKLGLVRGFNASDGD